VTGCYGRHQPFLSISFIKAELMMTVLIRLQYFKATADLRSKSISVDFLREKGIQRTSHLRMASRNIDFLSALCLMLILPICCWSVDGYPILFCFITTCY
jgi:hypothetical protein